MKLTTLSSLPFLTVLLVVSAVLPAHAEYAWNPFSHMSDTDMLWMLLLLALYLVFSFVLLPMLLGWLTHHTLLRLHPAHAVSHRPMLLWACLVNLGAALLLGTLQAFVPYPLLLLLGLLAPVAGAVLSYRQQRALLAREA